MRPLHQHLICPVKTFSARPVLWSLLSCLLLLAAPADAQCVGDVEWQESSPTNRFRCGRPGFLSKSNYYQFERVKETTWKSPPRKIAATRVVSSEKTYSGGMRSRCDAEHIACGVVNSNYTWTIIPYDAVADLRANDGGPCDRDVGLTGGCSCLHFDNGLGHQESDCQPQHECGDVCFAAFNQLLMLCCDGPLYYRPTVASVTNHESVLTDDTMITDSTTTYVDGIGTERTRHEARLDEPITLEQFSRYVIADALGGRWWDGRFFLNSLIPDSELQCLEATLLRYRIKFNSKLGVKYTAKWSLRIIKYSPELSTNIIHNLTWTGIGNGSTLSSPYFRMPSPALFEVSDGEVFDLEIIADEKDGCAGGACPEGPDSPGDGPDLLGSAQFLISLGPGSLEGSAGVISFHHSMPSPLLATPAALQFDFDPRLVAAATNHEGAIHLAAPLVLARIEATNRHAFWIHCSSRVPAGTGYHTNAPFLSHLLLNPNGDADARTLQHIRFRPHQAVTNEFVCEEAGPVTNTWRLISGNGLKGERLAVASLPNNVRWASHRLFNPSTGEQLSRIDELHRLTPSGHLFLSQTIDPTGLARLTTNSYDDQGRLILTISPTGSWERREYTPDGLLFRKVRPLAHQPPSTPTEQCQIIEYDYTPVPESPDDPSAQFGQPRTVRQIIQGHVVGKTMHAYQGPSHLHTRLAAAPDAGWNDPNNQITESQTDGAHRTVFAKQADGTHIRIARLDRDGGRLTITRLFDAAGLEVRTTEELIDRLGRPVTRQVLDPIAGQLIEQEQHAEPDVFLRPTRVSYLDGTSTTTIREDCCNTTRMTDRDGLTTTYGHDPLRRLITTTRQGITISNVLDAAGRLQATYRHGTSGRPILLRAIAYDAAGRITRDENPLGGITRHHYSTDALGQPVTTTLQPDGGTRVEIRARDGRLASLSGTAVHPVRYEYSITLDDDQARLSVTEIKLDAENRDTPEWERSLFDAAGRRYKTIYPGPNTPFRQSSFNAKGQLWKERDPDGVVTLYGYNNRGEREFTCLDANQNDRIDLAGEDRIIRTVTDLVPARDTYVHRTRTFTWTSNHQDTPTLVSTVEQSVDGRKTWEVRDGSVRSSVKSVPKNGAYTITETEPHGAFTIHLYRDGRLASVAAHDSNGVQLARTSYTYDPHGRVFASANTRTGRSTFQYNGADQIVRVAQPGPDGQSDTFQVTITDRDRVGRPVRHVLPDGSTIERRFSPRGEILFSRGARTYPMACAWDAQGRLIHLTNWSQFALASGTRVTTWQYHPERGWLTRKIHNDGQGPRYDYTPAGRLRLRQWARGTLTSYAYDRFGDLEEVHHDDGLTPSVSYTRNRAGHPAAVSSGDDRWQFLHNAQGQLLSESAIAGTSAGLNVTHSFDSWGRRIAVAADDHADSLLTHTFTHDAAGRLATVASGPVLAQYAYVSDSRLVSQIRFQHNGALRMTTTRHHDLLNRLTTVASQTVESPASPDTAAAALAYAYNAAGQKTRTTQADGSFWLYDYDALGQLVDARRYWDDWTPVAGQQFAYAFDDIGNRTLSRTGGDETGAALRSSAYAIDSVNQIVARTVPSSVDILGQATAAASLEVNGQLAYRRGEYFRAELAVDNSTGPAWHPVTARAMLDASPNPADATTTQAGHVFVPSASEAFVHDADGNLLQDDRWTYVWDAENRLTSLLAHQHLPPAARFALHFRYDPFGRRISKTVSNWTGTTWNRVLDERYVHDGWNLLTVLDAADRQPKRSFLWGNDLSGTMAGAGGVGGLLAVSDADSTAFAIVDGLGNVSGLVDAASGVTTARYEYGPFGEPLRCTGPAAHTNPFRFSTRFHDDESDLVCFGHRYYHPQLGRWLSRDPLEEKGGLNLFAYVDNQPTDESDFLGLVRISRSGHCNAPGTSLGTFSWKSPPLYNCSPAGKATKTYSHENEVAVTLGIQTTPTEDHGDKLSLTVSTSHSEGETELIELGCCAAAYWQYDFNCACVPTSFLDWEIVFWNLGIEVYKGRVRCQLISEGLQPDDPTKYCPSCHP